ncbi:fibronectin type III domain-containing protein [Winogradskyella helgolandensis]|uniref:fibronectin type III domain-containing protein n=1 Tax=Winogradskyella helgolandensis TaxID=2697010 RepID=UPI0015CB522C|nr:T9SS type A sorting domain-containing protein [Winogradskyella helgolandensis]
MKKITFLLLSLMVVCSYGQVSITEDFTGGLPTGWTDTYDSTTLQSCAGTSFRDNIWSTSGGNMTTSNYAGISNGTDITYSIDYKVVDYYATTSATADGWGSADLQYSTDNGTTWITVVTLNDSNDSNSIVCTTFGGTILGASVPTGSDLKFRILNTWLAGDYYFYIDNFVATQVSLVPPNCDSNITSGTTDFPIDGTLTWSAATGIPTGYKITMGSTTGGTDIANNVDLGTTISYTPTGLAYSTTYYTTITPYNANGDATGCTEQSFLVEDAPPAGTNCANPLDVGTLPYTAIAQTTAGFGDDYSGSPGGTGCTTTSAYLNGDDIVYSYTSDEDGSIDVDLTNITDTYTGVFIYSDCTDIGTTCATGDYNGYYDGTLDLNISNFPVLNGTTYYIVVSTWATPQDTTYDLSVTKGATCLPVTGLTIDSFTAEEVQVSWTASSSGESNWEVLVQADGTGSPTSGTASATNPYTESGLTELTAYEVYVRADCGGGDYGDWVGPVDFTTSALCPDVSDITIDSFTADSVTVSWTNGGTEDDWEVLVQADGTESPASGTATTTNPYTESGLTGNTDYEVYVRANCTDASNGFSEWVGPVDFTTACEAVTTFPYLESFEGITSGQPECWSIEGTTTNPSYHFSSYATGYSGRGMRFDSYYNSSGTTSELITPTFDASALTTLQLKFQYKNPTGGNFEILVSTNGGTTYTSISTGLTEQVEWTEATYDISSYISNDILIKFKGTSNWGSGDAYIYLDEVLVRAIPTCPDLTGLTIDSFAAETAEISWTSGGSETDWEVLVQADGTGSPELGTPATTSSNPYSATGLTELTAYEVYVRADCGGTYGAWLGPVDFTTSALCPDVSDITIDSFTADSVTVSWTNGGTEDDWEVLVQADGTGSPVSGTATATNPYTESGLTELTAYEVYVRADCNDASNGYSEWVGPVDFTTEATPITSFPYAENFDSGAGGWSVDNGLWELGAPAATTINTADSGTDAWVTNLTGDYTNNVDSAVMSPPFDFSGLTAPVIELSIWYESEFSWDGMVLQSSIDGGSTWQNAGALGDPNNWFNDGTIGGNTGGQQIGWTGSSSGWLTARNDLTGLGGQSSVILRVAFGSDGSSSDEGAAFDTVSIYDPACRDITGLTIDNFTAETAEISWTAGGSETDWEVLVQADGTGSPELGTPAATTSNPYSATSLTELTAYEVYVRADCGGSGYSTWVGPIDFTTTALCPDVSDITIDSFTADSVTVSWTNGGTEDDWEVLVQADGTGSPTSGTATATNPYTESGLTGNTAYEVYVRADCSDASNGYSEWVGPIDFTTACATYTPDYTEDFTTFLDACWDQATGGDLTTGPSTLDTGSWTADGFANSGSTGAARINYYGAGPDVDWLLSPTFDLSADGYELIFDSSIVDWNGTTLTETFNTGDVIQLVYSTDGTNWLVLYDLITNTPAAAGETITVDLTGITSSTVQFAIFTDDDTTNTSGRDLDIFIDNFTVRTPWTCTQAVIDGVPTVNEDCGAGTFTIDINFTTVGDATGITDGTDTFTISGTSVIAGPYTIGTIVNLEVIHAEGTCDFTITGDFTDNCPPANDNFANAIAISCGDTVFGNTAEATLDEDDAPDPSGFNADTDSPNLWYSFYGTGQDITLSTINGVSDFDTEILVFTGSSGNLNFVASGFDESGSPDYLAEVTFTAEAGVQYWISAEGYNLSDTGIFQMDVTCTGTESFVYDGGTWTPSDPTGTTTLNDIVIFAGDAVMTGDTDCNSFTVLPGAGVTIPTGATVTTAVAMTLESSSTSYSSLILDGTVSGTINYKRHVNSNASGSTGDNDLISAPLTGQAFNTFVTGNSNIYNNGTLYAFGPFEKATNTYVTWAGTESSTLNAGVGYRAASNDNDTFTFTGVANSGTVPVTIESSGASFADWNLVGNPYPSYITLADFLAENNSLFSDSTSGVYGYDGNASDGWEIWNQAYSDANDNALITPGQGFFVSSKNATGTLNFTNTMRSTGTTDDFIVGRSNNNNNNISHLRLKATNSNKAYHTDFYFNDSATLGLDPGYDSGIYGSAGEFALYSHLVENNTGTNMGIQTINNTNLGSEVIIPLGVNATQGQQLTFTIAESTLTSSVNLYLEDNVTNTSTLLNSNDYVLTPNTDLSGTGRFYLRFSNSTLSTLDNTLDQLSIYSNKSDKTIVISGQLTEETTAKIYDIQGRVVMTSLLENTSRTQSINVSKLNAGVYVVQLINGSQNKTQKVIIH